MNTSNLTLQLIRNTYGVNEGESIINQLINDKISFLKKQIFKLEERYGVESPFLGNRIKELKANQVELEEFLASVDEEDQELLISCSIDVKVVPTKSSDKANLTSANQEWI